MFAYQLMPGDDLATDDLGRAQTLKAFEESDEFHGLWHMLIERENGTTYDRFVDLLDNVTTADEQALVTR